MVTIEFKDIYSKSDMLLSNIPSMTYLGSPLKSAGEFFIKAVSGTNLLTLNTGKKITVEQPAIGGITDAAMIPFIAAAPDSVNNFVGWSPSPLDSLSIYESNYIFSLYSFSSTIDSGTWCNSDNGSFFSSYSQTTLTMHTVDDMTLYSTDVFLVFSGINSMVHVYQDGLGSFPYTYAPEGLNCTMVAIASKEGKLYSSFIPVSITSGLTVNFTLSETTDVDFKTQLNALN